MKKYIYLIERIGGTDYDKYESCMICGFSIGYARKTAFSLFEGQPFTAKKVGIALENTKLGILISSYKAG